MILLLAAPLLLASQGNYKKKATVLFLGNSYTYVNDLPSLIKNVALANGDSLVYDANTIGGYSLANHFANATSISKIKSRAWDYVVLQAQSQEPSFPDAQVSAQTLPYALKLDSVIKENSNCSNVVYYETWGRKNGDQQNCANYPPLCTYLGMQNRLRKWYKYFSDNTSEVMAPVGEAWRASIAVSPTLELYDPDQSHPSLVGSYLAACVFYETLFQRSVLSNTYNPGLPANTLTFLQQTAHTVLRDSLATWNIGENIPWADFTHTAVPSSGYQFESQASGLNNKWYFGDGSTSLLSDPLHAYTASGTYTVSHVVIMGCKKDSVVKLVTYVDPATGIEKLSRESHLAVYPNPVKNLLYIKASDDFRTENALMEISDLSGRCVSRSEFMDVVPVSHLKSGIYFIKISNNLVTINARFVKNE